MTLVEENVKHLSPSSLGTWEECRLKWRKQYAEGRSGDSIARGNTLGSFVHSILEGLFDLKPSQRVAENARAIATTEFADMTEGKAWGVINPDNDKGFTAEFKRDAWGSVLNALDLEDASKVDVAGIEIRLGGVMFGVPFKGFVDRLDNDGDSVVVVDYKNGKVPTYPDAKRKAARQLVLYSANLREVQDQKVKKAKFVYTAHDRIVEVRITDRLMDKTGEHLASAWADMHAETDWPASTSALCAWCPFVLECPEGKQVALARMNSGKSVGESTRDALLSES